MLKLQIVIKITDFEFSIHVKQPWNESSIMKPTGRHFNFFQGEEIREGNNGLEFSGTIITTIIKLKFNWKA